MFFSLLSHKSDCVQLRGRIGSHPLPCSPSLPLPLRLSHHFLLTRLRLRDAYRRCRSRPVAPLRNADMDTGGKRLTRGRRRHISSSIGQKVAAQENVRSVCVCFCFNKSHTKHLTHKQELISVICREVKINNVCIFHENSYF